MTPITKPIANKLNKLASTSHLKNINDSISLGEYKSAIDGLDDLHSELTSAAFACKRASLKLMSGHWNSLPLEESADA